MKFDAKELEEQKVAEAVAERLAGVEIEIARKVGEHDALFGSVTNADIAEALAAKGFDIDRRKIAPGRADQEARRVRGAGQAAPRRHA